MAKGSGPRADSGILFPSARRLAKPLISSGPAQACHSQGDSPAPKGPCPGLLAKASAGSSKGAAREQPWEQPWEQQQACMGAAREHGHGGRSQRARDRECRGPGRTVAPQGSSSSPPSPAGGRRRGLQGVQGYGAVQRVPRCAPPRGARQRAPQRSTVARIRARIGAPWAALPGRDGRSAPLPWTSCC